MKFEKTFVEHYEPEPDQVWQKWIADDIEAKHRAAAGAVRIHPDNVHKEESKTANLTYAEALEAIYEAD